MKTGEENDQLTGTVTSPSVAESTNNGGSEAKAEDQKGQTDRVQDEELAKLAEESRTIAQQTVWMEKQTFWLRLQTISTFGLGALTLIVLVFHGWMMWEQAVSNRQAAAAANDQLQAMWRQNRPWISVKAVPNGPLEFGEERASLPIDLTVTNTGYTTAASVTYSGQLWTGVEKDIVELQVHFCGGSGIPRDGLSLPADASDSKRFDHVMTKAEIDRGYATQDKAIPGLFFVGCASYSYGGQTIGHHTPFAYQVMTDDSDHFPRPVRRGENLPLDRIHLRRLADGRDYFK